MEKLTIQNEMACFDLKDRDFYDNLTTEERKKFSNFLMIRWGSSVQGDREMQEYYVRSCNHYLNKHFFAINRHPKLQWLGATAVSPGLGTHRHILKSQSPSRFIFTRKSHFGEYFSECML